MPKKIYGWAEGVVPDIAPHSLAKHRILREYIEQYLQVLTAHHGMDVFRISLVDGFAGGGEYHNPLTKKLSPGSPLILLDTVRAAEAGINSTRKKQLKIDASFVFVEKDPTVVAYLKDVLQKRGDAPADDGKIQVISGAFEAELDGIIKRIKSRGTAWRAIFVLDQYGYTDVPIPTIAKIFQELPNAEVFLTLAVGWITGYLPKAQPAIQAASTMLGISKETISAICAEADEELDVGDEKQVVKLRAVQQILHYTFTKDVGSKYYTPFFIISRDSNRPYWFMHIANNARANDVVKNLHWSVENHFTHFGRSGLMMLGYDPKHDRDLMAHPTFNFDSAAKLRTDSALLMELPKRIAGYPVRKIAFGSLFQTLCNETPATKEQLRKAVSQLCMANELEKVGGGGERRAPTTLPHDDDLISLPSQTTFGFLKK